MLDSAKIVKEFIRIKDLGFITSRRIGNTGIGKTFEDYLGVNENNSKDPDFDGFEVKSQRAYTSSMVTLFTKSPTSPRSANIKLVQHFGYPDQVISSSQVLRTTLTNNFNNLGLKVINDTENNCIRIIQNGVLGYDNFPNNVYWKTDVLEKTINNKLQNLFFVQAEKKMQDDGKEAFHYTQAEVFYGFNIEKLLDFVESGIVKVDIRMGVYSNPSNQRTYGRKHDHGTGFRIPPKKIVDLFDYHLKIG